ncbi:MAG: hypothetical protein JNL50_03610 [Phycisphaerae bacterium]|nr:hypothetical protein [Phycisphaerae bacterium]
MFATDRDLLAIEPNVFNEVSWVGQRLVKGTGDVDDGVLTLTTFDRDFVVAGVDAGHVVLVSNVAYEVLERVSATEVAVSRLRASVDGAAIWPADVVGAGVEVRTFGPQVGVTHDLVLRLLGIEGSATPEGLGESAVVNGAALARVEALGALHLVYAAAGSLSGPGTALWERGEMYRRRFAAERQTAAARVDTDGDGVADATRRMNVVWFVRG